MPLELRFESPVVQVGGTARLFVHSGSPADHPCSSGCAAPRGERRRSLPGDRTGSSGRPLAPTVAASASRATVVSDHQVVSRSTAVAVPWDDQRPLRRAHQLPRQAGARRDRDLPRRGQGPPGRPLRAGAAELLASMYDRSLDYFRPFAVPRPSSLYPPSAPLASSSTL
ncbi:MAG: hypothetical protein M5U09_09355 [Gammaproteobacteria bacterium]|nr:hypothetical protein [Gammaproteobacteria bacterium]